MAFNSNTGKVAYTASSGQTVFNFNFKIFFEKDLIIYLTKNGATPSENDKLVLVTDYTVSINGDLGGSITITTGADTGDTLVIIRALELTRLIEYQTSGDLLANTLNVDQDYQTYMIADGFVQLDNVLRLPDNTADVDVVLEYPQPNSYLVWDDTGKKLINDVTVPQNVIDAQEAYWNSEASRLTSESYATEFISGANDPSEYVKITTSNGDGTYTETPTTEFSAKWYEFNALQSPQEEAWKAEASQMTAESYSSEAEDVLTKTYTSSGDGTFSSVDNTTYSSLHYSIKANEAVPIGNFPTDEGLALVARQTGNAWEKILGLPLETGNAGKSVTNLGTEGDSFWSPITTNPNVLTEDFSLQSGSSASVVSGFTIADGITLTIPSGSTLSVV